MKSSFLAHNARCMMNAGMATQSPAAVVKSASQMPPASMPWFDVIPAAYSSAIWLKIVIIPVTVPKSPSNGDNVEMAPIDGTRRLR